jgi:hypothetical protein
MNFKEDKQIMLHYIYHNLTDAGIITSGIDYSTRILNKSESYYYSVGIKKYDLSLESTINAIYNIRKIKRKYEAQNPSIGYIHTDKITTLENCEEKLREYLRIRFRVAEIVDEVSTIYDDADYYGIVI